MSLFNQTVGIKVLGDLTNFIRQEMLEEADAEEQFKGLYDHYSDLLISHKAIQKDERQIHLLEPIIGNKRLLQELKETGAVLDLIEAQMPFFLGKIEHELQIIRMPNEQTKKIATDWESVTKSIYHDSNFGKELNKNAYLCSCCLCVRTLL